MYQIVQGLGFQIPGSRFRVPGSGFQVPFRFQALPAESANWRRRLVPGFRFRVRGIDFNLKSFGV